MDFEFQIQASGDDWRSLGHVATRGNRFDVEDAAIALRDLNGGELPAGSYRVRPVAPQDRPWVSAEVDEHGVFRRSAAPAS